MLNNCRIIVSAWILKFIVQLAWNFYSISKFVQIISGKVSIIFKKAILYRVYYLKQEADCLQV